MYMVSPGWYGEGDDFFFIDGEREPSLRGTGTEDYFCDGWGFREQSGPFYGTPLWEGFDTGDRGTAYRFHIPDPVVFRKSLRVEIEHKGSQVFPDGKFDGFIERDDLMSSVAIWYQVEPHKPWTALPPGKDRLPFTEQPLLKGHDAVASAKHSQAPVEVQEVGGVTDGKQLWFKPTEPTGWVEVPFNVDKPGNAMLTLKMVHSWDYGTYVVKLDAKEVARLNLYAPEVTPSEHKLGMQKLSSGEHTLRFECVGKAPNSAGFFPGLWTRCRHVSRFTAGPRMSTRATLAEEELARQNRGHSHLSKSCVEAPGLTTNWNCLRRFFWQASPSTHHYERSNRPHYRRHARPWPGDGGRICSAGPHGTGLRPVEKGNRSAS